MFNEEEFDEMVKTAAEDYSAAHPGIELMNDGGTIEDYDKPYDDFIAGVQWLKEKLVKILS